MNPFKNLEKAKQWVHKNNKGTSAMVVFVQFKTLEGKTESGIFEVR